MYSKHNEGKAVITERFIRILKKIINNYFNMKQIYIDKLDNILNKYNNTS